MGENEQQPSHYNQQDAETTLRFTIDNAIIGMTHRTNIMDESVVKALTEAIYQAVINGSTRWAIKILTKDTPCAPTQ